MSSDAVVLRRLILNISTLKRIIIHEHCKHILDKIALHVCMRANVRESEPYYYDCPDSLKVTILEIL